MISARSGGTGSGVSTAEAKGWTHAGQFRLYTQSADPQRPQKCLGVELSPVVSRGPIDDDLFLALDRQRRRRSRTGLLGDKFLNDRPGRLHVVNPSAAIAAES